MVLRNKFDCWYGSLVGMGLMLGLCSSIMLYAQTTPPDDTDLAVQEAEETSLDELEDEPEGESVDPYAILDTEETEAEEPTPILPTQPISPPAESMPTTPEIDEQTPPTKTVAQAVPPVSAAAPQQEPAPTTKEVTQPTAIVGIKIVAPSVPQPRLAMPQPLPAIPPTTKQPLVKRPRGPRMSIFHRAPRTGIDASAAAQQRQYVTKRAWSKSAQIRQGTAPGYSAPSTGVVTSIVDQPTRH